MFGLGLGRLGAVGGSRTLTQRALAILRTYGTDAHLWLPGVGVVNGITAGNFSDTAGTTASVVDSTAGVGLVVDAGGGTINATQGTTAAKPILRQASGKYSWQFDGTDFLTLGSVPFQQAADHCVVTCMQPTNLANPCTAFAVRRSVSTNPIVCSIRADGAAGRIRAAYRDDAGTLFFVDGPAGLVAGTRYVTSARRVSGAATVRVNAVSGTSVAISALGATSVNTAAIGVEPLGTLAQHFIGSIFPVIAIKGTVSNADLRTLEKFVGACSGVTI